MAEATAGFGLDSDGAAGPPPPQGRVARRFVVEGRVQGVGFRPFVWRLARQHGIAGWVRNRVGEVEIFACGRDTDVDAFHGALIAQAPPLARPALAVSETAIPTADHAFEIRDSAGNADAAVRIPTDSFLCDDCRRELYDPADRRFRYPFINCTQCGPRYTLIESLPYDRPNTSMARFPLCADCEREYRDPADRRFHAEPVACPACGPALSFDDGKRSSDGAAALDAALALLESGGILAARGIGGYHLLCDAGNEASVAALRRRKHRPDKPLAVMFPLDGPDGLAAVRRAATLTDAEAARLLCPERPIILLPKTDCECIADNVAPGLAEIGVLLPYSPLHELLLAGFGRPLVATSGNLSGEPVLTRRRDAGLRLSRVADAFLHHDRPIVRPADDPVLRRSAGRLRPLRLGRGTAPLELELPWRLDAPTLAVGAHMKGTLALGWGRRAVVSPHIGDMSSPRSLEVFAQVAADLQALYRVEVERIACDAHPGYATHRWARERGLPVLPVWHHHAHAGALAAEAGGRTPLLVFAWDGVGLGEDGTLWGGEALLGRAGAWRRVASLRPFRLGGGDLAGREPWRSAAALHWETGRAYVPDADRDGFAASAWRRGLNCRVTSAAGRVFDAAAALILGMETASFEAAGPMRLEALCRTRREPPALPLERDAEGLWRSDWEPLLDRLAETSVDATMRAEYFHAAMAGVVRDQARRLRDEIGVERVGLTGGVFQNRSLAEQAVALLEADGFGVHLPEVLPANDAAISAGQLAECAARDSEGDADG